MNTEKVRNFAKSLIRIVVFILALGVARLLYLASQAPTVQYSIAYAALAIIMALFMYKLIDVIWRKM